MKKLLLIVPLVLLSACDLAGPLPATPTGPPTPVPEQDTCNAAQHATLIGQDATALERVLLLAQVRVTRPGQAVTMDFRPSRINFNVGADNRIKTITCG
ncbi:I78 family peptidase inhibitor [Octadecabacter sp. 1_MG-2023]|uniref:I78 family peptidase inhibitor n=1 Tax=unclassified Octadecabacter TaxID=196158 RepID=UPI001C096EEE|nr:MULTISPECIES: I78 family peptidase inhibitor [unclassified Octadecabacter]MBU2992501.1 hypothetical protein [Octadecabacter sp. B2R22]MDO6734742.1 I78 family peptidase inhibitor [Octadecabacter sp. 1_MG-2023]